MLHPRVSNDDEEAGDPRAEPDHQRGKPVHELRDAFFAVEKEAEKCGLEEKAEDSFHCERLANYAAGDPREARPVGAELELHGDAGDHAEDKVDGEDAAPEAGRAIPRFVAGAQGYSFEHDDEKAQAHSELRKQIMEGDGESEVQPVDDLGGHGMSPAAGEGRMTDRKASGYQVRRTNEGEARQIE